MTAKRFTMYQNTIYEDGNIISAFTCMKRLNALYEENEQLKSKLHQLQVKCGKQEEEIECLSEETIEKFKQDLQDGNFIEFTAR